MSPQAFRLCIINSLGLIAADFSLREDSINIQKKLTQAKACSYLCQISTLPSFASPQPGPLSKAKGENSDHYYFTKY